MNKFFLILITIVSTVAGCHGPVSDREFLTVDFEEAQSLRYEFFSRRKIMVNWGQPKKQNKSKPDKTDIYHESMKMTVVYTPVEIDRYGLTTIKATCESIEAKRSKHMGHEVKKQDAVNHLKGKSFTFTIDATGKIKDDSEMFELIRWLGKKSFRPKGGSRKGRIKEPDMISDFFATQWFLWDSVCSIDITRAAEGIVTGASWQSQLSVPVPMVMKEARNVTYTLEEIRETDKGRVAVIKSSYGPAKSAPKSWPLPYPDGRFRMSGKFGFLGGYKLEDVQGQGEELFNIDTGRTEQYKQNYEVKIKSVIPMVPTIKPKITIEQHLSMKLLDVVKNKPGSQN